MQGAKGKAPSVQWYFKDWLSDRKLQRCSVSTRGIWINLLNYMFDDDGDNRGVLDNLDVKEIARLGGSSVAEAQQFIDEAVKNKFCDIRVTGHGVSAIVSRRITRDNKERLKARLRKRNERERKDQNNDVTGMSRESHSTSPSPTPIPTPTVVNNTPSNEGVSTSLKIPNCPYQKIVDLYHKFLPSLPQVIELSDTVKIPIKARWRENRDRQDPVWWEHYFYGVSECDWLMGRVNGKDWNADLMWLVSPTNMTKVLNGRYKNRNTTDQGINDFLEEMA